MNKRLQIPWSFKMIVCIFLVVAVAIFLIPDAHAVRIKDITDIKGVRENHLVGYGLVVGL